MLDPRQLYGFLPSNKTGVEKLATLALDMRWSWNHAADKFWRQLDPGLWDLTQNPWLVLQTVSRSKVEEVLNDSLFKEKLDSLLELREKAATKPAWFQEKHPEAVLTQVAYFSMEFMLNEALPIYVGGLGNVAGDQLKSASDLGVPVTGIGLFYQQGYFRQEIDQYGNQQVIHTFNDPGQVPITPLRNEGGEWIRIQVPLGGYKIWLRTWEVQAGRVRLCLLDSNDPANLPVHRGITNELYGGGADLRIKQEIILGIGGWKLLDAINLKPEVCHLNEGHSGFVVLERARDYSKKSGCSFYEALSITRAGNVFTTHTAVPAGFDHFNPSLMENMLGKYTREELGISMEELLALGRENPDNQNEYFNMAYLAVRGSGAVNGVSQLHGKISRQLFRVLFPRWPIEEIPIGHVTNGVHMPSWDNEYSDKIWSKACGKERWRGDLGNLGKSMCRLSDDDLWQLRNSCREGLIHFIRERFERQALLGGSITHQQWDLNTIFDKNVLTLGFARRFVPYKRPNLLLNDKNRLLGLLNQKSQPLQLVLAGKAGPNDEFGKALIREWIQFIEKNNLYQKVVFLSDYDMEITAQMVSGVDLWLNTPIRPWEACGTSGMKVLVNGGLNLSTLDGWWAEAYSPEVGWAINDAAHSDSDGLSEAKETEVLFDLLEHQIIPEFYQQNEKGIPTRWIERIRKSMSLLAPVFSANRTVREYTENYYLPAATRYLERSGNQGELGKKMYEDHMHLKANWDAISFGDIQNETIGDFHVFQVAIRLGEINPEWVIVEIFSEGTNGGMPEKVPMERLMDPNNPGVQVYRGKVTSAKPMEHFTIRVRPNLKSTSVPLEVSQIFWEH
ncbi:alpha-glucan family phosphorylase [Cyclobacterium jeungdonense]|uniref:Alpha-glucan family phosphorylase n=1 Tax=Cyclobacterium jeungdonense TaxID=708087 RepID=A0ABT8CG48_9BACT|nr:alpha-glucan family phosphorylase [Cyclobacterium jeungdonense]MDN3690523.1 alpha-glucan family phosphorylase [Cyclobacterium jeungdonense]